MVRGRAPCCADAHAYNREMLGWSLPVGRIFGVEVRLHAFFVFLLFLSMSWASLLGRPMMRGVALWAAVLLSVAVRECARGLTAAWFGVEIRGLLLLPTGGILSFGSMDSVKRMGERQVQRGMALAGPLASLMFGLTLAGLVLTAAPGVNLLGRGWVSPDHLLRALVWVNLLLAAVNLLPAWPLDAGRVVQAEMLRARVASVDAARTIGGDMGRGSRGIESQGSGRPRDGKLGLGALGLGKVLDRMKLFSRVGPGVAIVLICFGILSTNWWAIIIGLAVMLGAQVERQDAVQEGDGDAVKVRDVMLSEYSILSASATLEDAVEQARHTLQDVFPVVRAGNMVGAVGRQEIVQALQATGNGYVQGIMARSFETAAPEESLVTALGRVTGQTGAASQLVPVVVGERIVGVLTPQNLQRSMRLLMRSAAQGRGDNPGARSSRRDDDETD